MYIVKNDTAVIILAAGLGTRMKSKTAKVLHEINHKPMVLYVIDTAKQIVGNTVILVIGYQADLVKTAVSSHADVMYAYQEHQLGTGHAVLTALPCVPDEIKDVIVLCGDVPLLSCETLSTLIRDHKEKKRDVSVLVVEREDPFGYGRIIFDEKGRFSAIVEEADTSELQKKINIVNTGIYCFSREFLIHALANINTENKQGEMYLTDLIEMGYSRQKKVGVMIASDPEEFIGVNSVEDLLAVVKIMNRRKGKIS